jgi:sulfite exporter TauE/SafE
MLDWQCLISIQIFICDKRENCMQNLILAFVTGLTTGGLSCLAVQGGLLASSLGNQIEKDLQLSSARKNEKKKSVQAPAPSRQPELALPIAVFVFAKLIAYTLMGLLLGAVGSMFQLSPVTRAILQIAIGVYMVGAALRMLNVHPIFRYFVFETPAFLRRRIRQTAKAGSRSLATPAFLGFLTVLIPCGITQAMMAVALGTGSALEGAALMFAFTLGTSPVFFTVAYFATKLGSRMEKYFMRFVAVVMLFLGIVSMDTGLTLAGSPVSLTRAFNGLFTPVVSAQAGPSQQGLQEFIPGQTGPLSQEAGAAPSVADGENVITINVKNNGYSPNVVHAKAGTALQLRLVSTKVYSCSLAFVIPSLGVQANLESSGEKVIEIPAQEKGSRLPFSCSMGMFTGEIIFD